MPDADDSTRVTFPRGALHGTSTVLQVIECVAGTGVITAETPFHPLDHTWPDQPADHGTIGIAGQVLQVHDCVTGARRHGSDTMTLGADIPARRGDADWSWYVVHLVDVPFADCVDVVGQAATLEVDGARRARLSACHTACHLMAFAINQTLAPRWRKSPKVDSLGNPDFDALAITSSRIGLGSSIDTYRLGKSLRKRGFAVAATEELPSLTDALGDVASEVTSRLNEWIASDAAVRIRTPDDYLTSPREWVCGLPRGAASVRCGGTHVHRLGQLGRVGVTAELTEDTTMLTVVTNLVGRG